MTTKTNTKVKKKATTVAKPVVTMTVKQAQNLQAFAAKNNKDFKFLSTKINNVLNA